MSGETLREIVAEMRKCEEFEWDTDDLLWRERACDWADRIERASGKDGEDAADRRDRNEFQFVEFCNSCWDVPSEDHPILKLSTADLRRIYKLAEHHAKDRP